MGRPVMQRREEQASEHDHQATEASDELVLDQFQLALQLEAQMFKVLFGRNVVVDRVEDLGGDAFGLLTVDIGVRQGVGQGKPVSQWRLRSALRIEPRGGRPMRNRPCRGALPIRRAAILAQSGRLISDGGRCISPAIF
jgi:hypothetical protein